MAALALAPVLPALVNACLEAEDGQQLLEKVVEQLREAGHHPVAATVQVGKEFVALLLWSDFCFSKMQAEGVPDGLKSLAMMAQRWLKRDL